MINILYIMPSLRIGTGTTSFVLNYFHYIRCSSIHIDFLVISEKIDRCLKSEIEKRGSIIYSLPIREVHGLFRRGMLLHKFFSEHGKKYDIIHSHVFLIDVLLFYIARQYGKKVCVSHAHATNWSDYKFRAVRNRIMGLLVPRYSDVWAACTESAGMFLFGNDFVKSSKRWIVHNAIEIRKFAYNIELRKQMRNEFGYKEEIVLGNIGALQPVKNQEFLLYILQALIQLGNTQYKLLIVGDGSLKDILNKKAESMGLKDYVTFAGVRSDIHRVLQAIDIFLMPSLHEGFCIAGLEAQASGLPCLFSEGMPKDVGIIDAQFLPLNQGTTIWVDKILQINLERRKDVLNRLRIAGYDIEVEARKVEERYTDMVGNKC